MFTATSPTIPLFFNIRDYISVRFFKLTDVVKHIQVKVYECAVDPNRQCLSDNNNVISGTKGQNKCVCLNVPRLQFQSPPH